MNALPIRFLERGLTPFYPADILDRHVEPISER